MMDALDTPNGMTIRQLKDWLSEFPDCDPDTGEPHEVFVETGYGSTGPVLQVWPMNHNGKSGDVGLYSRAWDNKPKKVVEGVGTVTCEWTHYTKKDIDDIEAAAARIIARVLSYHDFKAITPVEETKRK